MPVHVMAFSLAPASARHRVETAPGSGARGLTGRCAHPTSVDQPFLSIVIGSRGDIGPDRIPNALLFGGFGTYSLIKVVS